MSQTSPAASNIEAIIDLERKALAASRWSARVSDTISRFAGSLWFVLCHLTAFTAWALWNAMAPVGLRFDPYPYGLLTFIVSLAVLKNCAGHRQRSLGVVGRLTDSPLTLCVAHIPRDHRSWRFLEPM